MIISRFFHYIWALREATTNSIHMMVGSANQRFESWLPKRLCTRNYATVTEEKQSAMFSSQAIIPSWLCEVKDRLLRGMEQRGAAWWENTVSLQPSRLGGCCCVCLCVENKEHLPVQNLAPSQQTSHKTLMGPKPLIRQTSKRPLVEDLSPIPSCILEWKKVTACDRFPSQQHKHSGQAIELCCQSLWCKQLSLLH